MAFLSPLFRLFRALEFAHFSCDVYLRQDAARGLLSFLERCVMAKKRSSPKPSPVPGSTRQPIPGAKVEGPVAADEIIDVTIRLREGQKTKAERVYRERPRSGAAADAPLTREELAERVSARPEDVSLVEAYAHEHGLTVLSVSLPQRSIQLRGPASAMQQAFGTSLERVVAPGGSFRQRTGSIHVPASLSDVITGVFGLDDRPQAKPHFRLQPGTAVGTFSARASTTAFTPVEIAKIYEFPKGDGKGQCIALLELGGGYKTSDLNAYATSLGLPVPNVVALSVDGAHNHPTGNPNGPDGEVVLDVEVAAGVAPAAKIAVYFAPNTDRGFLDAVSAAVHDTNNRPGVISISWGGPESSWTKQSMDAMTQIFSEAASIGVPVFVAAGDDGATDGVASGELTVDFPAASPAAIACGGTRLEAANGKRTREVVWNDLASDSGATGGGFSKIFQAPSWQKTSLKNFKQHMRGVPDVSANADPQTGYRIRVDGKNMIIGGTSAVAPLMAGLVALCAQKGGATPRDFMARIYGGQSAPATAKPASPRASIKLADFEPSATTAAKPLLFDVIEGKTDGFIAGKGWDACTGLGVPVGSRVLKSVYRK